MPRNSSGIYSLPPGNPVIPDTIIESAWANTTMADLATAITGSLPRDGSAAMTAQLTLSNDPITNALHAVHKGYVDNFIAFATGLPVGCFITYGGANPPSPAFILCNGQAISRTLYPDLFLAFGTMYGDGDGATTFNVPDAQKAFFRGRAADQQLGLRVPASIQSHAHPFTDPGHGHAATQPAHNHTATQPAHNHTLTDPGHAHTVSNVGTPFTAGAVGGQQLLTPAAPISTTTATTGITLGSANPAIAISSANPAIAIATSETGITIGAFGDAETAPEHILVDVYVKALADTSGPVAVLNISSSDPSIISIDATVPTSPELVIHSNVAFGTVKLDASGKIPINQMPSTTTHLLGFFDASGGQNPSEKYPLVTYSAGDLYLVSVAGLISVYDPVTLTPSFVNVLVGWNLFYITGSATSPTGWYYQASAGTIAANSVIFTPTGTISATDVQAAIAEVATDAAIDLSTAIDGVVPRTSATGAAEIPAGTSAQRPPGIPGEFRYNSDLSQFEGFNGVVWGQVGGGATGAPGNSFIYENDIHVTADYTLTTNKNGMSAGPITVDSGTTVTVPSGSVWTIV